LLWLTLISAPLISYLQIRASYSEESRRPTVSLFLFAFAPIALFLLGHSPGELFYWPMGAAAYLTTLSAITLCFLQVAFNLTEHNAGRVITSLSLIFAAGSSETGAFFAVVFGCLSLTGMAVDMFRGSFSRRKIFWCLVPALIGMGVFALFVQHRVQSQAAAFPTAAYHSLYLSAKAGLGQTLKDHLVTGQRLSTRGVFLGVLLKVCFCLGIRYSWLSSGIRLPRRQVLILFSLSLFATTYFSVAASYYGYGGITNQFEEGEGHGYWHEELRQCLVMLVVATVGVFSCHYRPWILDIRRVECLGGIFVLGTLILVVPRRCTALIHDYRNYSVCIESRNKSWDSGLSDGNAMIWFSPPKGQVTNTFLFLPGTYDSEAKHTEYVYIMQFFGKERLEIRSYNVGTK
jgi:hypothetical protein